MREKRLKFTLESDRQYIGILDEGYDLTGFEVCNLLNSLYQQCEALQDENEQLKRQNKALKDNSLTDAYFNYLENSRTVTLKVVEEPIIQSLKEENEQLKAKVNDLSNMELEERDIVCGAGRFRLEEWGKHRFHQFYDDDTPLEDETVVIRLMELTGENEQLRQILKDIVEVTDETYTKNKNIYKVTVVFDGKMYNQIRRCLNE